MAKDLLCVSFKQHSETVDEHNICDKDCALSRRENLYFIFVLHSVFYVKSYTFLGVLQKLKRLKILTCYIKLKAIRSR